MKKIRTLPLLWLLLVTGCASGPDLRVGITPNYPPLAFLQNGNLSGVEPDLAQQIGKQSGRRIIYEILPFDRLLDSLQAGTVDVVMAGISGTPERQAVVTFSDPYLHIGQMLLIREKDLPLFPKALFDQRAVVRIGVEQGSTGEAYALKTFDRGAVMHFDNTEAAVRALEQGGIDCFIHDAPTIWRFSVNLASQHPGLIGLYEPLTDEPLAWAVRKQDTALLNLLNTELTRMRQEGKLQAILRKWIPTRVQVETPGARN